MALSLIFKFSGVILTPASVNFFFSLLKCSKSITIPVPIIFTTFSRNIPEGKRFNINLPLSFMTVCPALFPP